MFWVPGRNSGVQIQFFGKSVPQTICKFLIVLISYFSNWFIGLIRLDKYILLVTLRIFQKFPPGVGCLGAGANAPHPQGHGPDGADGTDRRWAVQGKTLPTTKGEVRGGRQAPLRKNTQQGRMAGPTGQDRT